MKHPAAQPRKPMKEIPFAQVDNMDTKIIGRRTGKVLDDKLSNGNDFLLKDEFSHLLDRNQNLLEMYSSSSDDSGKNSKLELSSSSSEAEEASDEESASENNEKPTKSKLSEISKASSKLKEKKDLSNIRNQLLKESEPYDVEIINGKLAEIDSNQSEISEKSNKSSPNFNKANKSNKQSLKKENEKSSKEFSFEKTNNIQNLKNKKNSEKASSKNISDYKAPKISVKKNEDITNKIKEEEDGSNLSFVTDHKVTIKLIRKIVY
jgi:hypothetical protein